MSWQLIPRVRLSLSFFFLSGILLLMCRFIGGLLALSTRGAVDMHILRLYDVRGKNPTATSTIRLEAFEKRSVSFEGEVNCAAFSPDGIYLALGRNDNRVHMYDVRMLDRGPLLDYVHSGESRVSGEDCLYGVVKAQWIWSEDTRRNALVTGGEDGESMRRMRRGKERRLVEQKS